MLRIKDPARSVPFYRDVIGMTLLDRYDFPAMKFSLYFMGYPQSPIPEDRASGSGGCSSSPPCWS